MYIYGQNYKTTLKNEEKDIVYNFKSWNQIYERKGIKSIEFKIWRTFNSFLFVYLHFKILFWHKYKTDEQN